MSLALVHSVFDVSNFVGDPEYVTPLEVLDVDESSSYEEVRIEILDQEVIS